MNTTTRDWSVDDPLRNLQSDARGSQDGRALPPTDPLTAAQEHKVCVVCCVLRVVSVSLSMSVCVSV